MSKEGKKSRKFGRNSRSQSGKAYKAGNRWEVNKRKREDKAAKQRKRDKLKVLAVPRGTARAKRRIGMSRKDAPTTVAI